MIQESGAFAAECGMSVRLSWTPVKGTLERALHQYRGFRYKGRLKCGELESTIADSTEIEHLFISFQTTGAAPPSMLIAVPEI